MSAVVVAVFFASGAMLFVQMIVALVLLNISERVATVAGWVIPIAWAVTVGCMAKPHTDGALYWPAVYVAMILPPMGACRGEGAEAGCLAIILMTVGFWLAVYFG